MAHVRSAGAVVVSTDGGTMQTLLLEQVRRDGERQTVAPKGRIEPGETPLAAACREVTEESGLTDLVCIGYLGQETYTVTALDGAPDEKTVDWFLFATDQTTVTPRTEEGFHASRWVPLDEAADLVSHASFAEHLRQAEAMLKKREARERDRAEQRRIYEWVELDRTVAFSKRSRAVERVTFLLPDDSTADFYIKNEGPAAGVLALTPDQQVVLVRQYRPGPKQILAELPGGFVDPDEHPTDTVRREFLEETGYDGEFEFVGTCIDDAYSTMVRHCYVATNCYKVAEPRNTRTEQTEVVLVSLADFRAQLRAGRMTDVEVGYLCLDHLDLL